MRRLPFLDSVFPHERVRDFWKLRDHAVPSLPGVYVLLASAGTTFMYPRRRSSVFYIGKAANLRKRLYTHLRYALQARSNRQLTLYWPMYEYAAAFGGRYTFILAEADENSKQLEEEVLASFAESYRSWPVANGVGAWQALRTLEQLNPLRLR
jgi:hypothetical protein